MRQPSVSGSRSYGWIEAPTSLEFTTKGLARTRDICTELTQMTRVALDSFAIVSALMAVLWGIHLAIRNAAIVDAGWAAGLPMIAAFAAWQLEGGPRAWLLAAMVALWGLRLSAYLLRARVIGHDEEGRYVELRRTWRTH